MTSKTGSALYWARSLLSSTPILNYLVGNVELLEIRKNLSKVVPKCYLREFMRQ